MLLFLLIWLIVVAVVALSVRASSTDRLKGDMAVGWLLVAAGFITCWAATYLVDAGYFFAQDTEYLVFRVCGLALFLTGAVLVPVKTCQLLDRVRQNIQELEKKTSVPASSGKEKIPAWKRVEEQ